MSKQILVMISKRALSVPKIGDCFWSHVEKVSPDPIFGLVEEYKKCKDPKKVNLVVGTYRDANGNAYVLTSVRKAERIILNKRMDKEYARLAGNEEFCKLTLSLALGDNQVPAECVASIQTIAGSGALKIAYEFFKYYAPVKLLFIPYPTWSFHRYSAEYSDLEVKSYKYYNPKTFTLDFDGLISDIKRMPKRAIILFHACAHNPTGVDPTEEQWRVISTIVKERNLFPLFDFAYQGLATGDFETDAFSVRQFVRDDHEMAVIQSYAKSMGLYGEGIGALSFIVKQKEEAESILTQLTHLAAILYGPPPIHGQRIVSEILTNNELREEWREELCGMYARILSMRGQLKENLIKAGSTINWDHLTNQVGMFGFTGLTQSQVEQLSKDYYVYLTKDGRISIAGLNSGNVEYVANAIHAVTK